MVRYGWVRRPVFIKVKDVFTPASLATLPAFSYLFPQQQERCRPAHGQGPVYKSRLK